MAKLKQTVMSDEDKKQLLNKSLYLSEAFLVNGDSEISMNALVDEIAGAKEPEDVEKIYRQHNINRRVLGQRIYPLNEALYGLNSEYEAPDDLTPIYAQYLSGAVRSASALCELYTACLRIARGEEKKPAVSNIVNVLYLAHNAFDQMIDEVRIKEETLHVVYEVFPSFSPDYRFIPNFPLLFLFKEFHKTKSKELADTYGIPYNQSSIQQRFPYRYWEDPDALEEVKEKLWTAAYNSEPLHDRDPLIEYTVKSWRGDNRTLVVTAEGYKEDLKNLREFNDKWFAEKIIGILDRYTEKRLSDDVQFKINSIDGKISVASSSIDTALALWTITQIQNTEDCRICIICGRVFKLRAQKGREACYLHPTYSTEYFKRKLKEKKDKVAKQSEGAQFEVVYRRSDSEVEHESESNEEEAECC